MTKGIVVATTTVGFLKQFWQRKMAQAYNKKICYSIYAYNVHREIKTKKEEQVAFFVAYQVSLRVDLQGQDLPIHVSTPMDVRVGA